MQLKYGKVKTLIRLMILLLFSISLVASAADKHSNFVIFLEWQAPQQTLVESRRLNSNYNLPPDAWIQFDFGTRGPSITVGNNYYALQTSLAPVVYYSSRFIELVHDFTQDNMVVYHFTDGNWTEKPIYQIGQESGTFMSVDTDKEVLLMIHGLFTGDYLAWTDAAKYLSRFRPDLEIYAVDYGTGYPLQQYAAWLETIICQGVPENSKINILAHSQGGLLSRVAIEGNPAVSSRVKRLITLATPHLGVDYGESINSAAIKVDQFIPEIGDLIVSSAFIAELNSLIESLDVEYYFVAGTSKGHLSIYWDILELFSNEELKSIVSDAVVEKDSALGIGLSMDEYRLKFETAEFPVNHNTIMSDSVVLDQILQWLK